MKTLIETVIITLLSIFILKSVTTTKIIEVNNSELVQTEKILKTDFNKEETVVKKEVKLTEAKEKPIAKKLGSKTNEKTQLDKNTAVILSQKVRLRFDENLNESYKVSTDVIYWTKATGSNYVYSNNKYDISVEDIEDIKLKEYKLAVLAKNKILKINENKNTNSN